MTKLPIPLLILVAAQAFGQAATTNGPIAMPFVNEATTGTTLNGTAVINSSGQAIGANTSQTTVPTFIVVGGAGITGSAQLATAGIAYCRFSGTTSSTGGQFVVNSTVTSKDCQALNTVTPGTWVIGSLYDSGTTSGQLSRVLVTSYFYGGSASPQVYPGAGVANSNGSSWLTSYQVGLAANNLVQLNASGQLPAVSAALLTSFPTFNQNTTGQAGTALALASLPTNCGANIAASGILANGNATGCFTPSFATLASGTSNNALLIGSGGSFGYTGTGTVNANYLLGQGLPALSPGNLCYIGGIWTFCPAGTGTVTSIGLLGTSNQITVTGTSPITTSGSWTLSLPSTVNLTNLAVSGLFNATLGTGSTLTYATGGEINSNFLLGASLPTLPVSTMYLGYTGSAYFWGTPSGAGTVTSVSCGALSPLFTCNVLTPTSVPAISFSIDNATAGTIFGNPTGSTTAPSFYGVTSPLAFSAGALGCATCTTSAASLTNNAVVIGGSGQATSTIGADTTTTHALFATAGAPAFRAIALGDLPGSGVTTVNGQSCALNGTCTISVGPANAISANPYQLPASLSTDICGGTTSINSLLTTYGTSSASPTIDLRALNGTTFACQSDPWVGLTTVQHSILQGGFTLQTDVPLIVPTEVNWHGVSQVEGGGSTIEASSTFHTNFPLVAGGSGSATLCGVPGSDTITMGTYNGTTCVAGGTGTFTPTGPPSSLVNYLVGICPTGATCVPSNTIFIGQIYSVTSASVAVMTEQLNNPVTAPATSAGYQYVFVMPVMMPSLRGTSCIGTSAACDSEHQEFDHITIDCNDTSTSTDQHVGYPQLFGQEGTKLHDASLVNCAWSDFVMHGNKSSHSGPYTNINAGKFNVAATVPVSLWGIPPLVSFTGLTIVPNTATTMDMYINNQSGGGATFINELHMENATSGVQCGDTITWPWVTGGTGCSHVHFSVLSGNSNLTNVVHFVNSTGNVSAGDIITSSTRASSSVSILDDVHSTSITNFPSIYSIGAPNFPDGVILQGGFNGTETIASGTATLGTSAITSGSCATAVTATATGALSTDTISADFNTDPSGLTGYGVSTSGVLTIYKYPSANLVSFKVCNSTGSSITPSAATLNWAVRR